MYNSAVLFLRNSNETLFNHASTAFGSKLIDNRLGMFDFVAPSLQAFALCLPVSSTVRYELEAGSTVLRSSDLNVVSHQDRTEQEIISLSLPSLFS